MTQRMVELGIIAPVTTQTDWVSSFVSVQKPGKVRICIDPPYLNAALKKSHYPLLTIDDISARLQGANVFSVLDAKTGFWHVKLEDISIYLTTFNTPNGRYRWLRRFFGIASAPEEWQPRMHEIIESLRGIKVIADFSLSLDTAKHVQPLFKTTIRISKNFLLVLLTKASSLIWKRSVFVCEKSNLLDIPSQVKESNLIRRKLTLFLTCLLPKMLKQSYVF